VSIKAGKWNNVVKKGLRLSRLWVRRGLSSGL
jgi:hypothetical protein